jgi:hypothetical protein
VATPAQVDVWAGLDAGKGEHFAEVLGNSGERLFARAVRNGQRDLEVLLERAGRYGTAGLVMRRAADLYPGEATTGRRDACVLADTGRTRRKQVRWLDASSGELLAQLRVLNGFGTGLAAGATRLASRLRDALTCDVILAMLRTGQPDQPAHLAPGLAEAA